VVLSEREPVPDRIELRVASRVLAEVPQQVALEAAHIAPEAKQARRQPLGGVSAAAEREIRAVPTELLLPRVLEQPLVELEPALDSDLVHAALLPEAPGLHSPHGQGARLADGL
jgi:hypothetical protein